jgi:hypothetical protein
MFDALLEKLLAFLQEFLQQIKDWFTQNPGAVKDKVMDLLHAFDSWLHNFMDEVNAIEPPAPPATTTETPAPAPAAPQKKK